MTIAFVFPGQGSQAVGMGKALASNFSPAQQIFAEVDEALGSKLSTIIFEGPADTLTLTENAQPALMAVSLAVQRVLEAEAGLDLARDVQFVAGQRDQPGAVVVEIVAPFPQAVGRDQPGTCAGSAACASRTTRA